MAEWPPSCNRVPVRSLSLEPYRRLLARRGLVRVLVIALLIRLPVFATGVVVTIHVVTDLGRSYGEAGIVAAAAVLSMAVSGPIRGRLLDRHGLRPVIVPALVVSGVAWGLAPWVGFVPLLVLVVVAGLFIVPTFSVSRQAIIAAVPEDERRSAISLDSALLEVSAMVVPAVAVWASTVWGTPWVLFGVQMCGVVAGMALWIVNPPLRAEDEEPEDGDPLPRRLWLGRTFVSVCVLAASATLILAGSDLAVVAMMREFDRVSQIGLVLAVWALGSLVGGLVYGALDRSIPSRVLLVVLAVVTVPMAFATSPWQLAGLAFVAGLLCAPTLSATIHEVSQIVPAGGRGEAMGWHGSATTVGGALGAPVAGFALDSYGPGAGFVAVAVIGGAVGLLAFLVAGRPAAETAPEVTASVSSSS